MLKRILLSIALLSVPSLASAAIYWEDHMDSCETSGFCYPPNVANGIYTFDATMKFAGTGSIRGNFPPNCNVTREDFLAGKQCGGSMTRVHPDTPNAWSRLYFRMSGRGPNATPSGLFESSRVSVTKMVKRQSLQNSNATEFAVRGWIQIGNSGGKNLIISRENVPTWGRTNEAYSNMILQDDRWYCIETQEVVNTPGVANGVSRIWVDGKNVLDDTNVMWQRAGSNFLWHEYSIMRQNGAGNFWWDEFAAGDTRIGCLGAQQSQDNPPAAPTGLAIKP